MWSFFDKKWKETDDKMISCLQHGGFQRSGAVSMIWTYTWFIVLFLKIFETKFENLWCDFFCQAVWTRLYDKLVKLNSLPLEVKMQWSVNLLIVLFFNYAYLLLLAWCLLAACDIFAIRLVAKLRPNLSSSWAWG